MSLKQDFSRCLKLREEGHGRISVQAAMALRYGPNFRFPIVKSFDTPRHVVCLVRAET